MRFSRGVYNTSEVLKFLTYENHEIEGQWAEVRDGMAAEPVEGDIARIDWPQFDIGGEKSYESQFVGSVSDYFAGVEAWEQQLAFLVLNPVFRKAIQMSGFGGTGLILMLNTWSNLIKRLFTCKWCYHNIGSPRRVVIFQHATSIRYSKRTATPNSLTYADAFLGSFKWQWARFKQQKPHALEISVSWKSVFGSKDVSMSFLKECSYFKML